MPKCPPCSIVNVVWCLSVWLPLYCCIYVLLFLRTYRAGVAGKFDLSEGGLSIGGWGIVGVGGVRGFKAGQVLAGHERFCWEM
jgi:hypothetical protein